MCAVVLCHIYDVPCTSFYAENNTTVFTETFLMPTEGKRTHART